jgi:hypothetical protein
MFQFENFLLTFTNEVPPPSPLGGEGKGEGKGKKEVRCKNKGYWFSPGK